MRPNNSNKRTRSRSRGKNTNPLARSYESNGPDVKIRGSAIQVADKYAQLARDAQSSGDRVMAENYFQHAEHYYRIVAQAYEQNSQNQANGQRDRRDDQDRGNRYEDRNNRGMGDQPNINGFDGIEDEDEGVRRALRANTHNGAANGNGASDDHDEPDEATTEPRGKAAVAAAEPDVEDEAQTPEPAEALADSADAAEEPAKPKRRARAPRAKPRKRADADGAPVSDAAPQEGAEPPAT